MTPFTPTHVHKETGEKFVEIHRDNLYWYVHDTRGERRAFLRNMLTDIQPVEGWEPVSGHQVTTDNKTGCLSAVFNGDWHPLPHPAFRLVDGCRLERRKA